MQFSRELLAERCLSLRNAILRIVSSHHRPRKEEPARVELQVIRDFCLDILIETVDRPFPTRVRFGGADVFAVGIQSVPIGVERIDDVCGLVPHLLRYLFLVANEVRAATVLLH